MLPRCSKVGPVGDGHPERPRCLTSLLLAGLAISLSFCQSGCARAYYRKQADKDVNILFAQKDDSLWKIAFANVYPHPKSRFADPSRPDRPPMPVDDPAAKKLSPNPQLPGKSGVVQMEGTGYLDILKEYDEYNRNLRAIREKKEKDEEERKNDKDGKDEKEPKEPKKPKEKDSPKDPQEASAVRQASSQTPSTQTPGESSYGDTDITKYADPRGDVRLRSIIDAELADPSENCKAIVIPESSRFNKKHPFLINLEQSVELAILNSREFQSRRESLYLAALPVTQERFALSPQLFSFGEDMLNKFGKDTPTTGAGPIRQWSTQTVNGVAQVFCTGAVMLFNFANQTIYNFGQIPSTSISTVSLDVVQPFLRAGGFAVTLEPLTQAERNLLYEIRDFYKFRQEFFVFIAAGQAAFIPGVTPGVLAFSGGTVTAPNAPVVTTQSLAPILPGFIGGFPTLENRAIPGSGTGLGGLFPINSPGATPQGFLQTVFEKASLVVTYQNIDAVRRYLQIFRVYLEGGIVALAQVNQVEQQLLSSIENALNSQVSYRISLDQFKFQMGIPQCVDIDLDDEPLEPMYKLIRLLDRLSKDQQDLTDRSSELSGQKDTSRMREQYRDLLETSPLTKGTEATRSILDRWGGWARMNDQDLELRLSTLRAQRRELLDKKARSDGKLDEAEQRRLERVENDIQMGFFERSLRRTVSQFWQTLGTAETDDQLQRRINQLREERQLLLEKQKEGKIAQAEQRRLEQIDTDLQMRLNWQALRAEQALLTRSALHRSFLAMVEEAFDERQKNVGDNWPCLPLVCVSGVNLLSAPEDIALAAMQKAALEWRVDLMNYRAQVVDAWREITVSANALLGFFNVQYSGQASSPSPGYHPLAIGGSHYQQQLIFNWTLPLLRITDRNLYRASLINFQAARRRLMQGEDNVLFQVRIDLRQLRALGYNFHNVQKRAIVLAYQQVDVALQAFSQPQAPAGPATPAGIIGPPAAASGGGGGSSGGDPAALTQQLLNAQRQLLSAQTDLYNTWIGFLINRMDLYRDMGIFPMDKRGVWLDAESTCDCGPRMPDAGPHIDQPQSGGGDRTAPEQLPEPRKLPEQLSEPRKLPEPAKPGESRPGAPLPAPGPALD